MELKLQTAYVRRCGPRTEYRGAVKDDGRPTTLHLTADALPADFVCRVNGRTPAWDPAPAAGPVCACAPVPPGEPVIELSLTADPAAAVRVWLSAEDGEWESVYRHEAE